MSGIGLVDRGAHDGADVEAMHVVADALGAPGFLRQRDVEVGRGGVGLKWAGRVHDAWVVARMKGGVSSSVGRTSEGMVTMCLARMKSIRLVKVSRKLASNWSGAGCLLPSISEHLLRRFAGVDLLRECIECGAGFCAGRRIRFRAVDRAAWSTISS